MASFSFQEIFGNYVEVELSNGFTSRVIIGVDAIRDTDNFGDLPVGIGFSNGGSVTATQMLYGILMMLMKNQGATVNTDPTQKVYITDAGKSIATGVRDGQVRRSFTVSFYIDAGLAGVPSIDQIDS